jgi:large subunit ribosomal protein LP2
MKYVAALLLAQLGGNESPAAADIKKILSSVGIDADASRINALLAEVSGKSIDELIKAGSSKLASMPAGGAAPAATGAAPAAGKKEAAAAPAKKEESEEEEMGFGLFD